MRVPAFSDTYPATRSALQRIAVHVVARARQQATGRFGLRVTPGGFGTPEFGDDLTQVRVSGDLLVRQSAGTGGATSMVRAIGGSTLRDLAATAEVDLGAALDVGSDTPALGDPDEPITVDAAACEALATWYAIVSAALDRVVAEAGPAASPTATQLWPEHFDVALDLEAAPGQRLNVGGSPGDSFHDAPYAYVGPWTEERPGEAGYWNAPFGAAVGADELRSHDDPVGALVEFALAGVDRFG